ncbi:transposase IS116/IS110/IS902 family protein [Rhodococcus rhodochrous J45]|uniref:Transposase IS116/IS110/IS902 family protein n=2 Tax=Rhodococcus rhodochrous TaxID=1829 RepID=A0A562E834_RHORH|nr:transposase IS116/IS110/IS902 family protein [Rhodococcus rhodochrous J45]
MFCGIDWSERHHDVAVVDQDGNLVAKRRIGDDAAGLTELLTMLAELGDHEQDPVPVAIETPRGLLVAAPCHRAARVCDQPDGGGPLSGRWTPARSKSDHADAMVLANILRTDQQRHRPLPADSELVRSVAVLARAHQDATWRRTRAVQELRSLLREYYPGFLAAFAEKGSANLASADARAVLAIAPTPADGVRLTRPRITAALRRGGRQRNIEAVTDNVHRVLRQPQLRHPALVEQAMGQQALALLAMLNAACDGADQLGQATAAAFRQHPDYGIVTSFPGLGELTGARVLAEIGDDRTRFADARSLRAYAGSAPVTRASGRSHIVTHRRIKNDRLAAAGFNWAFMAITHSSPARAHYDGAAVSVMDIRPHCETCSTASSVSYITASAPDRSTIPSRPSARINLRWPHRSHRRGCLTPSPYRRSVSRRARGAGL